MDSVEKQPVQQPAQANVSQKDRPAVAKTDAKKPGLLREKISGEDRLLVLCDGVFAIATTLLVIDIKLPSGIKNEATFNNALADLFSNSVVLYVITFAVIASLWVQHRHMMRHIKYQDARFTWFTLLFLVFIAFFPVTSNILETYGAYHGAVIIYTLTFSGCGLSLVLLWLYASWHHRLIEPDMPRDQIVSLGIGFALTPIYFSLSLLLLFAPLQPADIFWSWLLLPFVTLLFRAIRRRQLSQSLGKLISHQPKTR